MNKFEVSVIYWTDDFRGDHSADVGIAIQAHAGNSIEWLIDQAAKIARQRKFQITDRIEIRLVASASEDKS